MSKKIARITQDKKLLLANEVVESNAKTSLNSDGRLDTNEIIEYPAELEGGRNLARIQDYSHDNQYQTVTKTDETFNGQPVYHAIKKTGGTPPTSIGRITIRKGETFTASIWIKHEQQPTVGTALLIFYKDKTLKEVIAKNNYGKWERLIVTYTNNTNTDIENVNIYFYPANGAGDVTYFTCPKIEKGNKATDWTPAPEDLGLNYPDSIQNFNSSISGNNIIAPEFIEGYPFIKPVIDDSLVLWLDGSTGNNYDKTSIWRDLSGNGNDGELVNFGYTEDSGWGDGGLRFDGVDDYVDCKEINLGNSFTIEHIFKAEKLENIRIGGISRIGSYYDANSAFAIEINNGHPDRTRLQASVNKLYRFKDYLPKNNFYLSKIYLVLAFDINKGGTVYLDGEKLFDLTLGALEVEDIPYNYPLVIGENFIGNMDLIRIYNRALTDEEIMQNYQAGQCSPLLAMRGDIQ